MKLQNLIQNAWSERELDLFSQMLQYAATAGPAAMAKTCPLLMQADPQGIVYGRALLWAGALGPKSSLHRQLLDQQLRLAATHIGVLSLGWFTAPEEWETPEGKELPPRRKKALALLAEAAARGVKMPALCIVNPNEDESAIACTGPLHEIHPCSPLALAMERQTVRLPFNGETENWVNT